MNKKYHLSKSSVLIDSLMEKRAVDLNQLTKAYSSVVKPLVNKAPRSVAKAEERLVKTVSQRGAPQQLTTYQNQMRLQAGGIPNQNVRMMQQNPGMIQGQVGQMVGPYLKPNELAAVQKRAVDQVNSMSTRGRGVINMPGDQSQALRNTTNTYVPSNLSGEAKNMYNRTVGLHEAAELKAFNQSASAGRARMGPTFESHFGPNPMLNDVNIANTLTGKGSSEASSLIMRTRRPELMRLRAQLSGDVKAQGLIDKLLGGQRISRHGRKYLDQAHAASLGGAKGRAF